MKSTVKSLVRKILQNVLRIFYDNPVVVIAPLKLDKIFDRDSTAGIWSQKTPADHGRLRRKNEGTYRGYMLDDSDEAATMKSRRG